MWHVPHGNVQRVANLSAASLAVIDLEIDRSMPLDRVDAVAEELREAVQSDELVGATAVGRRRARSGSAASTTIGRLPPRRIDAARPSGRRERRWTTLAVEVFHRAAADGPEGVTPLRSVRSSSGDVPKGT